MEPVFTMQYGEFAVADYLSKKIKNASVFIPASSQEKGIDLLLYRHENGCNTTNTIQVKMSRTYYDYEKTTPTPTTFGLIVLRFRKMPTGIFLWEFMPSGLMMLQMPKPTAQAGIPLCWLSPTKKCKLLWQK